MDVAAFVKRFLLEVSTILSIVFDGQFKLKTIAY